VSDTTKPALIIAKPPKPPIEMTDDEINEWAETLAQGLNPDG